MNHSCSKRGHQASQAHLGGGFSSRRSQPPLFMRPLVGRSYSQLSTLALSLCVMFCLNAFAFANPNIPRLNWTERSDWLNVKKDLQVNAIGDGIADDTAALQEALNHFTANASDTKVVYLPKGVYRITSTLEWPSSVACSLMGRGRETILLWDGPNDSVMLRSRGGAQSRFDGITWDANHKNTIAVHHNADQRFEASSSHFNSAFLNASVGLLGSYGNGANLATSEMIIENCLYENCEIAIDLSRSYNYYNEIIRRCEFRNNGIGVKFGAGYGYVRFCHFENSSICDIIGGSRSTVRYCSSEGSKTFYDVEKSVKKPAVIQNCSIKSWNSEYAITATNNSLIFDNIFTNPPSSGAPIYFYDDEAIVSQNISESTTELYAFKESKQTDIIDVPAGQRTRLPIEASDHFLSPELEVPTVIFDAVKDFGALTGQDDSVAVQACIDAARNHGRGAMAYFPVGRYKLSTTIHVTGSDYSIGGTGYHSEFQWVGEDPDLMFSIHNPSNLLIENLGFHHHLLKDGCTAMRQTANQASSIRYQNLSFPGKTNITSATARLREGLHLLNLNAQAIVHIGRLQGRSRFEDCGRATIVGEFLNGNHNLVDGSDYPHSGFLGWGSSNGHDLRIQDNQSIVIGDANFEQSGLSGQEGLRSIYLSGSEGDPQGRATFGMLKSNLFDSSRYYEIQNYAGQFSILHGTPYPEKSRELIELFQRGQRPVDVVFGAFYVDKMPIMVNGDSSMTYTSLAGRQARQVPHEWYGGGAHWTNSSVAQNPNGVDKALMFDGLNDFLLGPVENDMGKTNEALSVSTWIRLGSSGQEAIIMGFMDLDSTHSNFAWKLALKADDTLDFIVKDKASKTTVTASSVSTLNSGTWTHCALTWNGSQIKLYLNGQLERSQAAAFDLLNPAYDNRLIIGGGLGTSKTPLFYNGAIDELRIYNSSLSAAQVSDHYNQGQGTWSIAEESGLVAAWHFDEGSRLNAYDANNPEGGFHLLRHEYDVDHNPSNAMELAASALDHFRELGHHLEQHVAPIPQSPYGFKLNAITSTSMSLQWSDRSTREEGFIVELRHQDSDDWSTVATLPPNTKTVELVGLQPGSTYMVRVRSFSSAGVSIPCPSLEVLTSGTTGTSLIWKHPKWSTENWDKTSLNWNPDAVAFVDGDEVNFPTDEITVNLVGTLRPSRVNSSGTGNNRWWLEGSGKIDDGPSGPTLVDINGGRRKVKALGPHGFSGGTVLRNGAQLDLYQGINAFGMGPIELDDGSLNIAKNEHLSNDIIIASGGGRLNSGISGWFTYTGTVTMRGGHLHLSSKSWDRILLQGDLIIEQDSVIAGGTDKSSSSFQTEISGIASGSGVLTVDVTGLGLSISGAGFWSQKGLTKTGLGTLRLSAPEVCGDILRLQQGKLELQAPQTVKTLYFGNTQKTASGTYGSSQSGALFVDDTRFEGSHVITLE